MHHVTPCLLLTPASETAIADAVALLHKGRLVAFPTETVYGLGADATNLEAVKAIYTTKGRPSHNPLIIHVENFVKAQEIGVFNSIATSLAEKYWPGPLTMVVPMREEAGVYPNPFGDVATVAIRCPDHPVSQRLLSVFGKPLAAPSANRSGRLSTTKATDVYDDFRDAPGALSMILDGGECPEGIESTIINCIDVQPSMLRYGSLILSELSIDEMRTCHTTLTEGARLSPGLLSSHYAPSLPVRMNATTLTEGEVLLGFGPHMARIATYGLNLSESGNLEEAAHHLYDYLRKLDRPPHYAIAVMPIPDEGLGKALNDRLRRASAPRE